MSISLPSRRWFRFSLRTFLVFVTLFCIWAAWWMHSARRQKQAVDAIREYGGWVYYDYEFDSATRPNRVHSGSPWPTWVVDAFGVDMLHNVVEVNLVYSYDSGKREDGRNASDEIIPHLEGIPNLRRLFLHSTQVTDATMPHIARLRKLEVFFVWDAHELSDKGVQHLAGLKRLRDIHINDSRIGDESLRVFGQLPRIEQLSLQGNHFSDEGLTHLEEMERVKSLWIGLSNGKITDQGAMHLLRLRALEVLEVSHASISPAMQNRLRQLPNLKQLYWSPPLSN
jgi:hypothetical protein